MVQNNITKWSLILSLVVVINLLFNYGISSILEEPKFDEICSEEVLINELDTETLCSASGGDWKHQYVEGLATDVGYCHNFSTCNDKYEVLRADFEQKIFFILIVLGALLLLVAIPIQIPTLASAFSLTAAVNFVFASIRYWEYSEQLLRVGVLFVALLVLILVTIIRYTYKQKKNEKLRP